VAQGQTLDALLKAVAEDNMDEALFFLDRGMEADTTDKDGNTLLMIAARMGYMDMATMLIERKASVTRQTPAGDTPLLMASLGGHLDMVKLLVQAGAPIQGGKGWQPLHYAAFSGANEVVTFLLEQGAPKDVRAPSSDYTPLMLAVRNGHGDTAKVLLAAGADLALKNAQGETALMMAERIGDTGLVSILQKASGAPPAAPKPPAATPAPQEAPQDPEVLPGPDEEERPRSPA